MSSAIRGYETPISFAFCENISLKKKHSGGWEKIQISVIFELSNPDHPIEGKKHHRFIGCA